ncbi:MAG: formylmethanofuran dehydrogenase subunit C [Pirellulales bacterium]
MPLRLTYRADTSVPVEVEGLLPHAVRAMSLPEIERLEFVHGNEKRPLADFFAVAGNPGDNRIELEGKLAGVHWIGAKLSDGAIHVAGDVGRHAGSEMSGGQIHIDGDAGDWAGGEMHGGLIHIRGRAGDHLGAAYRGSKRGMTGGTILVEGAAGHEIGHTMRRGLLAVGGCGDFAGINMIAGTILVFGPAGIRPAAGMRRGTLGLFGSNPPTLLPTFRAGSRAKPLVLELLFRELRALGYPVHERLSTSDYRTYHGDLVTVGRGEILVAEGAG